MDTRYRTVRPPFSVKCKLFLSLLVKEYRCVLALYPMIPLSFFNVIPARQIAPNGHRVTAKVARGTPFPSVLLH